MQLPKYEHLLLEQTIYQLALQRPFNPQDREKYPPIARLILTLIEEAKVGKPDSAPTDLREYMRQGLALNHLETFKPILPGVDSADRLTTIKRTY